VYVSSASRADGGGQDVTTLVGSTVTLGCRAPSPSYDGFFEWRFYSSLAGDQIYSQPPFKLDNEFPEARYQRVNDYGLQISSVEWTDGGIYGCHFLTDDVQQFTTVIVIGESLTVCVMQFLLLSRSSCA